MSRGGNSGGNCYDMQMRCKWDANDMQMRHPSHGTLIHIHHKSIIGNSIPVIDATLSDFTGNSLTHSVAKSSQLRHSVANLPHSQFHSQRCRVNWIKGTGPLLRRSVANLPQILEFIHYSVAKSTQLNQQQSITAAQRCQFAPNSRIHSLQRCQFESIKSKVIDHWTATLPICLKFKFTHYSVASSSQLNR